MERIAWSRVRFAGLVVLAVLVVTSVSAPPGGAHGEARAASRPVPGEAPAEVATASVVAGTNHTCARLDNGSVKCWGWNDHGQLGLGDTAYRGDGPGEMGGNLPAVSLGTGRTAVALAVGDGHSCALLDNGSVKCWGLNGNGQLGLGDTANRGDGPGEMGDALPAVNLGTGRTAVALTAGRNHTCARLDDGSVKCWGLNLYGGLGLGDTAHRGDGPGEMGDALPAVSLGTGRTATDVAAGGFHTCARLDNGSVKCWGWNDHGQLGLGDTANRGDGPGEMGDALPAVSLGAGASAAQVSLGYSHSCARRTDGSVKCWGQNSGGRLGLGDTADRGDGPGEMGDALPAVSLGTGRSVALLAAGHFANCAILDDLTLKCWGSNGAGQLGLGDDENRGDGPGEMGDALPAVDLGTGRTAGVVGPGGFHTCARLDEGSLKCWGSGLYGQLGLGDTSYRGNGPGEMGDALPVVLVAATGVAGTVSETGSGAPLAGVWVAVLRTTDFSVAAGVVTDGSGGFAAEVAPGTYFLYVIDPTGHHVAGFHGPPTTVTVVPNVTTDADPALTSTRGTIEGRVTDEGTREPIEGVWVVTVDGITAAPEAGVSTDAGGGFANTGLRPGPHYVAYVDPTGAHSPRFYVDSPHVPGATLVEVVAAEAATADAALPAQAVAPGGDGIKGVVTESGSGAPLEGVYVIALRASDYRFARGAVTDADGFYGLDLEDGDYRLEVVASTGLHDMEWHRDHPYYDIALADVVTAPDVVDAALAPRTGTIAGTIVADPGGTPLAGVWVVAIGPTGISGGAVTGGDGTYTVTGLAPGTYRVTFADPNGGRTQEFWDDATGYEGATAFPVTAGATVTRDAALAFP